MFIFLTGFTLFSILFLFPLLITYFVLSLLMVFDAISFNIDSLIKVLCCILVELIDLVNCNNFCFSKELTQMVIFPTRIPPWLWLTQSCSFLFISFLPLVSVVHGFPSATKLLNMLLIQFSLTVFLIDIHSMQGWRAPARHATTRKKKIERKQEKMFRNNMIKSVNSINCKCKSIK